MIRIMQQMSYAEILQVQNEYPVPEVLTNILANSLIKYSNLVMVIMIS